MLRNDKLDLDILTGNLFDVVCGDSPEILEKVLITNNSTSEKMEDTTYSLWTSESWLRLDYRGTILEEQAHPYKILPFQPIFDYLPFHNILLLKILNKLLAGNFITFFVPVSIIGDSYLVSFIFSFNNVLVYTGDACNASSCTYFPLLF